MLDEWRKAGGSTFVLFGDICPTSKWGAWGLQESYLDTNAVKFRSVQQYLQRLKADPADLNKDGAVNLLDYNLWRQSYGTVQPVNGDANGDGLVDAADYVLLRHWLAARNLGYGSSLALLAIVPEPSTFALALTAVCFVVRDNLRSLRGHDDERSVVSPS
jgi:hypothetical protein